jgi:hypothetical protein
MEREAMSELREADEAVTRRQKSISEAIARATGKPSADVYRQLFIGMDVDAIEVQGVAWEHADAAAVLAVEEGGPIDFGTYLAASWMDGFSVAAMLFMRRREGNTR